MMKKPNGREFTDVILNNGKTAKLLGIDFWSRPYYEINHNSKTHIVCCTELDGTHLHYYSPRNDTDGEPDYPLPNEWQPAPEPEPDI